MKSSDLPPVYDPLLGRTVGGRYRLISRLGSGGMSSVYLARHVLIDRLMAIKCLRRELATDPVQRDRFMREARAVNRINHENIVEITDVGETDDGLVYLVMEYVPGEPLLRVMTETLPMPIGRCLPIAQQCAMALGRAHQMGVVHRDLKPENVLLVARKGRPDFVKVLDFGIAKIMDAPSLTASQQIFGTPGYIAPEYIQSTRIDGRADLYSLGVILYELVTGALPFDYQYPGDLLIKHVSEPPVPPRQRLATVDPGMEAFVLRCLHKDPDRRFRDAYHFLDVMGELVVDLGVEVRGWAPRATVPTPPPEGMSFASSDSEPLAAAPTEGEADSEPAIPVAPSYESVDVSFLPVTPAPAERDATPFDPKVDGILGVKRWRRRFDVLRTLLAQATTADLDTRAELRASMEASEKILVRFEHRAEGAADHQLEAERVVEEARELRAEFGKRIDGMGIRLSQLRGERDEFLAREHVLRAERERARGTEGEDVAVWAHAAGHAEAVAASAHAEMMAQELAAVSRELEERSEAYDALLGAITQALDDEMAQVEAMSDALRHPLDQVEQFVVERQKG